MALAPLRSQSMCHACTRLVLIHANLSLEYFVLVLVLTTTPSATTKRYCKNREIITNMKTIGYWSEWSKFMGDTKGSMLLPFKHIDTSMNVILAVTSRRKAVNLPESDLLYFLVAFP